MGNLLHVAPYSNMLHIEKERKREHFFSCSIICGSRYRRLDSAEQSVDPSSVRVAPRSSSAFAEAHEGTTTGRRLRYRFAGAFSAVELSLAKGRDVRIRLMSIGRKICFGSLKTRP